MSDTRQERPFPSGEITRRYQHNGVSVEVTRRTRFGRTSIVSIRVSPSDGVTVRDCPSGVRFVFADGFRVTL